MSRLILFGFGMYLLLPVAVLFAFFWFVDVLMTHAEARDSEQTTRVAKDWRPEIPDCDAPLWDRIREGCDD